MKPDIGARYALAVEALEDKERKMQRAFNAWTKQRAVVRSLQKRIDVAMLGESPEVRTPEFNGKCVTCHEPAQVNFSGQCDGCAAIIPDEDFDNKLETPHE